MTSERVVLIGASHAANSVIETLKKERFSGRLTLISEEKIPLHSPTALPYLLERAKGKAFELRPLDFYRGMELIEAKALGIEPEKGRVVLTGRKKISYDRLVIATGASARLPLIETSKRHPILTLRRIEDLRRIEEKSRRSSKILILGAGLIGLHLAQIFSQAKKKVHVIEIREQILPGRVPARLAHRLMKLYEGRGVRISLGVHLEELGEKEAKLSSGERISVDLAIATTGIRPNRDLADGSLIAAGEGIRVNEKMETSLPGIYACGDVAEYRDFFSDERRLNPNLVSAVEGGRCVAAALLGKPDPHPGWISVNTFRCFGFDLVSLGRIDADVEDRVFEEPDLLGGGYKQMVFRNGRLKGLACFNTPLDSGLFYRLLRERVLLEGEEERLFRDPLHFGKVLAQRVFKT